MKTKRILPRMDMRMWAICLCRSSSEEEYPDYIEREVLKALMRFRNIRMRKHRRLHL